MVTGGNGGLGLAMAKGLAKCGAQVAIWGRDEAKMTQALAELRNLGAGAHSFACDVTDETQTRAAFARTVEHFGAVDICFANAGGGGTSGPLHTLSGADWKANVDLNLTSVYNTFAPAIDHLLARKAPGKLVVTSSVAAVLGIPNNVAYSATKAAVAGLVRALAMELGGANIQVNAILPGFIETDMSTRAPAFFQDACRRRTVTPRAGTLEDMEGVAVYLASRQSDFMTGQTLVIDGGQSINPF